MKDKFQMSSMGELIFFLGLQVQQKKKGIFISQDKYVHEILRKFNYIDVKSASTPTDLEKPLVQDRDAADVDEHLYRSIIGSLMYLIASRPDIMFVVCACARFQVSLKTSHLLAVKRIFRYLKGKPSLGLCAFLYGQIGQEGYVWLLQGYVDDDIFGFTKKELCDEFKKLMNDKFQMSSMGELTFFLGFQVQQSKKGIFISQDKYVHEILRKFNYSDVKSASTPTDLEKPLVQDGD
ncbi:uncharacterized mitochondrial protein-like protein, partial [Tanacetum coccineum]